MRPSSTRATAGPVSVCDHNAKFVYGRSRPLRGSFHISKSRRFPRAPNEMVPVPMPPSGKAASFASGPSHTPSPCAGLVGTPTGITYPPYCRTSNPLFHAPRARLSLQSGQGNSFHDIALTNQEYDQDRDHCHADARHLHGRTLRSILALQVGEADRYGQIL